MVFIAYLLNYFKEYSFNVTNAVKKASKALACGEGIIYKLHEESHTGPLISPVKLKHLGKRKHRNAH